MTQIIQGFSHSRAFDASAHDYIRERSTMRFLLTLGILLAPTFSWAGKDRSDLSFDVDTQSTTTFVQPLLTDPLGRQTGLLGPGGPQINNIPNAGYTVDASENIETGTPGVQGANVGVGPAAAGQYGLILIGLAMTSYEGSIRAAHTDGSLSAATFQGFIIQNSTRQYAVNFDPMPG